jgi:hypothetical protein
MEEWMADRYYEQREALARFYAERMSEGFGPAVVRKLGWTIRDAEAAGDRPRAKFWARVREIASAEPAAHA